MKQIQMILLGLCLVILGLNEMVPVLNHFLGLLWGGILLLLGVAFLSGWLTDQKPIPLGVGAGLILLIMGIAVFYPLPAILMSKLWAIFFIVVGVGYLLTHK